MSPARQSSTEAPGNGGGFSLVEVTIAIGLFAFVVVGIMGLFPTALRQRVQADYETRSVLVARQLFESVSAAGGLTNVVLTRGENDVVVTNLSFITNPATPLVLGYEIAGTEPGVCYSNSPAQKWESATVEQDETIKARMSAAVVTNGLLKLTVEVGFPANLPAANRRIESYSALLHSP